MSELDYDVQGEEIRKLNAPILSAFQKSLENAGLSKKTVKSYVPTFKGWCHIFLISLNNPRFVHFPSNLLKTLDRGFAKSASSPLVH